MPQAKCDNCGEVFSFNAEDNADLACIPDLLQRIAPGGEVPAAACPVCGALAYVVREASGE